MSLNVIDFSGLAAHWPSTLVARKEIKKFSGGLINERYLANLDSLGQGPTGRIKCGRKIAYPIAELIKWLEARSSVMPDRYPK